jgi:RHS repeat-associated protein
VDYGPLLLLDGRNGSVVGLVDGSGAKVNSYSYDPYGGTRTVSESVASPYRYDGEYLDGATGLYRLGNRYYDPSLGRFTQVDPSSQEANPYVYAGDDPVNVSDPNGLSSVSFSKLTRRRGGGDGALDPLSGTNVNPESNLCGLS